MSRVKPILFNTDMVRAILDSRKLVTRRAIKPEPQGYFEVNEEPLYIYDMSLGQGRIHPPYQPGDILYVRETWQECCRNTVHSPIVHNKYCFKASVADCPFYGCIEDCGQICKWRPSIHMLKEAARIWLRVTDVRVERLQDISVDDIRAEGLASMSVHCGDMEIAKEEFKIFWDSTIKKKDLPLYGWDANPWVWVIEFERCEKPKEEKE